MTHQDRLGAAYHEAGHAVVATALGLTVARIEIAINGDDAKGAADIEDAARLPLVDQLAICAAGMEAQKMFEAPTHDIAGVGDYGLMFTLGTAKPVRLLGVPRFRHATVAEEVSLLRRKRAQNRSTVILAPP
jgi:hypothetical protein